jgi:signal transduction histidine kinase
MRADAPAAGLGGVNGEVAVPSRLVRDGCVVALGELVPGASHELNNPLSAILGLTELLLADAAQDTREHERLELIRRCAFEIRQIVHALLAFADPGPDGDGPASLGLVVHETLSHIRRLTPSGEAGGLEEEYGRDVPDVPLSESRLRLATIGPLLACLRAVNCGGGLQVRVARDGDEAVLSILGAGPAVESLALEQSARIVRAYGGQLIDRGAAGGGLELRLPAAGTDA